MPKIRTVQDIKTNLLRPALTSHFEVEIPLPGIAADGSGGQEFKNFLKAHNVIIDSTRQDKLNLSCSETTLPGSSLATLDLNNDFTGVTEKHAYRRIYDDRIDFTFYVDAEQYLPIRFFECWIKYISNESITAQGDKGIGSKNRNYFYRMRYPEGPRGYTTDGLKVIKFERDYNQTPLEYEFIKAFPISLSSMPVTYDSSSLLKCTVSMSYIRYIVNTLDLDPTPKTTQSPLQQAQFNTSNLTLPGLEGLGALNTGGIPQSVVNSSGNTVDRRVEAGLPYVGRNVGPIQRFSGI
jgi:hypothetical protein